MYGNIHFVLILVENHTDIGSVIEERIAGQNPQ